MHLDATHALLQPLVQLTGWEGRRFRRPLAVQAEHLGWQPVECLPYSGIRFDPSNDLRAHEFLSAAPVA